MKLVVDASVAAKWLFAEANSQEARQLLSPRIVLHAPDFILVEVSNVIYKKARLKQIPSVQPYIDELVRLPDAVLLSPSSDRLVPRATAMAAEIDHPVYDCLYLACAEEESAPVVTADEPLIRRVLKASLDVEAWHIGDPKVAKDVAMAATSLIIGHDVVRQAISAYEAFRETADFVMETVPKTGGGLQILTPEDRDRYYDNPAYLRLFNFIAALSLDERIDLKALAWCGREGRHQPWEYFLNHARRMGADDPHYEASLGYYWQAGLDRLNNTGS